MKNDLMQAIIERAATLHRVPQLQEVDANLRLQVLIVAAVQDWAAVMHKLVPGLTVEQLNNECNDLTNIFNSEVAQRAERLGAPTKKLDGHKPAPDSMQPKPVPRPETNEDYNELHLEISELIHDTMQPLLEKYDPADAVQGFAFAAAQQVGMIMRIVAPHLTEQQLNEAAAHLVKDFNLTMMRQSVRLGVKFGVVGADGKLIDGAAGN